jgi:Flp pilus assembly protein TadG
MDQRMSMSARISLILAKFGRSESGNIAVIFATAAVPLISFVGAAIDYTAPTPPARRWRQRSIRPP